MGIERHAGLDDMLARVNVGDQALDAVGDEFDRPSGRFRRGAYRDLVRVDVHLDAECAADVVANDPDIDGRDAQQLSEMQLHLMRHLMRHMH